MKNSPALVRKAQKRFRLMNKNFFDNCLPPIRIEVKSNSKNYNGTFVSFLPPADGKPYIILYKDVSDEVLLHEMVHYLLYISYMPAFKLSGQTIADAKRFTKKYQHTKEFWGILREINAAFKLV